jgi:hypothetical protein
LRRATLHQRPGGAPLLNASNLLEQLLAVYTFRFCGCRRLRGILRCQLSFHSTIKRFRGWGAVSHGSAHSGQRTPVPAASRADADELDVC